MRLKCLGNKDTITKDNLYHLMKEDKDFYYVVDDVGEISCFPKSNFSIERTFATIENECIRNMFSLEEDVKYAVEGKYLNSNGEEMFVIKIIKDNFPIALPKKYLQIIEE